MAENDQGGYLDRLLRSKPRLDDRIVQSLHADEQGRVFIQPEVGRINLIMQKIACGLFALKYGVGRPLDTFNTVLSQHSVMELPQVLVAALHYWPGIRRKKWNVVQPGRFEYLFAQGWTTADPTLWCFIEIGNTIFSAVSCPAPRKHPDRMLKARSW